MIIFAIDESATYMCEAYCDDAKYEECSDLIMASLEREHKDKEIKGILTINLLPGGKKITAVEYAQ